MTEDFSDASEKAAGRAITTDAYMSAKRWYKSLDISNEKFAAYRDGLKRQLGYIQVMGMADPKELSQLYVYARVRRAFSKPMSKISQEFGSVLYNDFDFLSGTIQDVMSEEGLDVALADLGFTQKRLEELRVKRMGAQSQSRPSLRSRKVRKRGEDIIEEGLDAIAFLEKRRSSFILGGPGSGKTTFLKYCALCYLGWLPAPKNLRPRIPFFVPLREHARIDCPKPTAEWLCEFATNVARDVSDTSFSAEWLDTVLRKDRCILLLDGLDEVDKEFQKTVIASIAAFKQKYTKSVMIVTCRSSLMKAGVDGFSMLEIEDFREEEIRTFADHWFREAPAERNRFISDLEKSKSGRNICKTPLLATMLCIMYGYARSIPANRAELYESCVDALMIHWDNFRAIDRPTISKFLSPHRKKILLSRIARRTFDKGALLLRREIFAKLIEGELDDLGIEGISGFEVISEIEDNHGLIVERAQNVYSFSHLSFHEYFCAVAYVGGGDQATLFQKFLEEPRYREVYLMAVELSYSANSLVMGLLSRIKIDCIDEGSRDNYLWEVGREIAKMKIPLSENLRTALLGCVSGAVRSHSASSMTGLQEEAEDYEELNAEDLAFVGSESSILDEEL